MTQTDDRLRSPAPTRVTPQSWAAVRAALEAAAERFAALVAALPDPAVRATEQWSAAETAAHVTGVALNYAAAVTGTEYPIPQARDLLPTTTVYNIHAGMNATQLDSFRERDTAKLVEQLRTAIGTMVAATETFPPDFVVTWMGGSKLPLAGILAHMMNELHIHGWDIARGAGVPWVIPDEEAALFFDLFIVEIVRHGVGIMLDDDRPVRRGRIAVRFESGHTEPVTLVLTDGEVTAEGPDADADVRVRFRPTAMNLMLWHRTGAMRTALSGAVVVRGRKPWLLAPFLRKVRMP